MFFRESIEQTAGVACRPNRPDSVFADGSSSPFVRLARKVSHNLFSLGFNCQSDYSPTSAAFTTWPVGGVAGKFEPTFRRTQVVWDDDLNVEGASEALCFKTKSPLRQIKLLAFQLPFNEVSASKDGVLYGGQAQTDWQFSPTVSANVNAGYYDWNHADQVLLGRAGFAVEPLPQPHAVRCHLQVLK
ncbi:MAG TPA: putative porin [Blastocatellia bacterium]